MNRLWNFIDHKNWPVRTKYTAACVILGTLSAFAGFALWSIVRIWVLNSWDWMFCFIGYPVVISIFALVFYAGSHDFHDLNDPFRKPWQKPSRNPEPRPTSRNPEPRPTKSSRKQIPHAG